MLIVDDEVSTTQSFASMLRLEGYRVLTALDAETGLREATTHAPDAILLDLRMPLIDGLVFLQRLRAEGREIPVAIVTGDYSIDDRVVRELHSLGAQVRFKPLWIEDLVGLVSSLLHKS